MSYIFLPFFSPTKRLPLLPFYQSPNGDKDTNINKRAKKLDMVFAAGPYTLDTDLEFEPFSKLIKKMISEKPEILVLVKKNIHYLYLDFLQQCD